MKSKRKIQKMFFAFEKTASQKVAIKGSIQRVSIKMRILVINSQWVNK